VNARFSLVRDFFAEFSRLKLFFLIFIASLIAFLLAMKIGGFAATAFLLVPTLLSILQITKGVWTPEGGGKSTIGLASLGVALLAVSSNHTWRPFIDSLLEPLFSKYPSLKDQLPADAPSIVSLLFLAGVILIVNFSARDKTAMKEHPTPVEKEFPEREYKALLKAFCRILRNNLDQIDHETNWSAEIFTPLDAEVEIQSGNRRIKKVADLLSAIKSDRTSRVFLVLGDPGSGKSVSLRKLCRDLLDEVESTGRVPIYVNLREWERKEPWTKTDPPSVEELYEFVLKNLNERGDVFTADFLTKYYKKMFENGRLFIVLDSFDEIPAVLDVDENSWLINKLSEVIHTFLSGAHESRGILASRIFRRPTAAFNAKTVLVIRPLTEMKIVEMLRKSLFYDESLIKLLFNERQEFIPIARNPFTAALISSYAKEHQNSLPHTQSELYSSYIQHRLRSCEEKLREKNLTADAIIASAVDIAHVMLTNKTLGLEASLQQLRESLPNQPISDVVDILRYARLARLGSGDAPRFSFAHRRFNEYFVVKRIKDHPDQAPISDIPTDSRWRDALVLFAEVADDHRSEEIAVFCWHEINQLSIPDLEMGDPRYLRAVHCLRFLKDAFRARLTAIRSFRGELADLIRNEMISGDNLISKKIALEAIALLRPEDMTSILATALANQSRWVNEIALKSCHYLPEASSEVKGELRFFVDRINFIQFVKRRRELILSLALSNIFSEVKWHCYWRLINTYACFAALLVWAIDSPALGITIFVSLGISLWLQSKLEGPTHGLGSSISSFLLAPLVSFIFLPIMLNRSIRTELVWDTLHTVTAALTVLFLLAVPWYRGFYYLPLFMKLRIGDRLRFVGLLVASLLMPLLGYQMVGTSMEAILELVMKVIGVIGLAWLGFMLFRYVIRLLNDYKRWRSLSHARLSTREGIATEMSKMRTARGRMTIARVLDLSVQQPTGVWPDGTLPNFDDDRASTLLAQLEEKWLGLDR
jgi:hypothetical protein